MGNKVKALFPRVMLAQKGAHSAVINLHITRGNYGARFENNASTRTNHYPDSGENEYTMSRGEGESERKGVSERKIE